MWFLWKLRGDSSSKVWLLLWCPFNVLWPSNTASSWTLVENVCVSLAHWTWLIIVLKALWVLAQDTQDDQLLSMDMPFHVINRMISKVSSFKRDQSDRHRLRNQRHQLLGWSILDPFTKLRNVSQRHTIFCFILHLPKHDSFILHEKSKTLQAFISKPWTWRTVHCQILSSLQKVIFCQS